MFTSWVTYAVFTSVLLSVFLTVNQYYKLSGKSLMFWARLIGLIGFIPIIIFGDVTLPTNPTFYIVVFITSLLSIYGDIKCLNASAEHGGGVVARLAPTVTLITFLMWIVYDPSSILVYLDNPLILIAIILSLTGCVYFSSKLNKCEITKSVFIALFPALIALALTSVLNKYAMDITDLHSGVFVYILLQNFYIVLTILVMDLFSKKKEIINKNIFNKKLLIAGTIVSVTLMTASTMKNYSMAFIDNPAYFAAVLLLSPVYISIFYKFTKFKEETDVKSGMGIVFCILILILATA